MTNIGVIIADTLNYTLANNALQNTIKQIDPSHVLVYTDHETFGNGYDKKIIKKITSIDDYNELIIKKIADDIKLDHYLFIQYDGFAINKKFFDVEFLKYDYIGAPWPQFEMRNVGNGGFSLRSKRLIESAALLASKRTSGEAEDLFICRSIGEELENKFSIRFANSSVASQFSYEAPLSRRETFGFHGFLNLPIIYQNQPNYLIDNLGHETIKKRISEFLFGIHQCENDNLKKFINLIEPIIKEL